MNAIVTGATKGIGKAIAELLARRGYNLYICARSEMDLKKTKLELLGINPNITVNTKVCDVSKKEEVLSFGDFVVESSDTIDVLVNNAGVFVPGAVAQEPEGNLEMMIDTNLYSAYHLTRRLLPQMRRGSHIFNMCSIASIIAYPNGGAYSISKFALLGFSKVLRAELKESAIKVTAILPGATWSASWDGVELPQERLMQASDIAIAVGAALDMSPSAVVEDIILRPQLGDL